MARVSKKTSKSATESMTSDPTSKTNIGFPAVSNTAAPPPAPFKSATASLLPLTKVLPKDHVYILHLETTPPQARKQAFLVPVLLNLVIVTGLCWRLYYAVPVYLEQIITILGYETPWTVKPKEMGWAPIGEILFVRTFYLTIDYVIFGLIGRWPWEFIFGDKYGRYVGALGWKRRVGFSRQREPIVRRGRRWDSMLYQSETERNHQSKPGKAWTKEEELTVHNKCSQGLMRTLTVKNALSLLDRDWDLDYLAMIDVIELIDMAKLSPSEIDHLAIVPWQGKWYAWYPNASSKLETPQYIAQKDQKLEKFKKALFDLDCEDVFFRWIEIIQYETSRPGSFTLTKKKEAEGELRKMLTARGKDDDALIKSIGGFDAIPGLSEAQ